MAKKLNEWLEDFVAHGANPADIDNWPKEGGGDSVYWSDILNKPEFAAVAFSGSFNDLEDKPDVQKPSVNEDGVLVLH